MVLDTFKTKIGPKNYIAYNKQYDPFWKWKTDIEKNGKGHILDNEHRADTCEKLLKILPGWQTWRGVNCDYKSVLPVSLANMSSAYNQIREYDLLRFDKVPEEPLELIWHELGRVKTESGNRNNQGNYYVVAICKPLMFLWGQTLGFDSRNRKQIHKDSSLSFIQSLQPGVQWKFRQWKAVMRGFQTELSHKADIAHYCEQRASEIFGSQSTIPYGRFLDIYYLS